MIFEAIVGIQLTQPSGRLPEASAPESFGFIITVDSESFSSAIIPKGSGHLVPDQPSEVCLRFLVPEAASKAIRPGSEFIFFEQHRIGTGRVISVCYA